MTPYPMIKDCFAKTKSKRKILLSRKRDAKKLAKASGIITLAEFLPKHKELEKKLDAICRNFNKIRAKFRSNSMCEVCGIRPGKQWFHWIPCGRKGVRWHPLNFCFSCAGCNLRERHLRSGTPDDHYRLLFIKKFGSARREFLESISNRKWSRDEMNDLFKRIKSSMAGRFDELYVLQEKNRNATHIMQNINPTQENSSTI